VACGDHPPSPPDVRARSFEWYVRVAQFAARSWTSCARRIGCRAAPALPPNRQRHRRLHPPPAVVRFDDVSEWSKIVASPTLPVGTAVAAKFAQETRPKAVEQLPERERHIVSQHYFRGGNQGSGRRARVSEPRISQLHSRAISASRRSQFCSVIVSLSSFWLLLNDDRVWGGRNRPPKAAPVRDGARDHPKNSK